jgi:hypothetical protein
MKTSAITLLTVLLLAPEIRASEECRWCQDFL